MAGQRVTRELEPYAPGLCSALLTRLDCLCHGMCCTVPDHIFEKGRDGLMDGLAGDLGSIFGCARNLLCVFGLRAQFSESPTQKASSGGSILHRKPLGLPSIK